MQIFKTNEFFCGLSIPDPGTIDPIEKKLPRDIAGPDGVDFMKVYMLILIYKYNDNISCIQIKILYIMRHFTTEMFRQRPGKTMDLRAIVISSVFQKLYI